MRDVEQAMLTPMRAIGPSLGSSLGGFASSSALFFSSALRTLEWDEETQSRVSWSEVGELGRSEVDQAGARCGAVEGCGGMCGEVDRAWVRCGEVGRGGGMCGEISGATRGQANAPADCPPPCLVRQSRS